MCSSDLPAPACLTVSAVPWTVDQFAHGGTTPGFPDDLNELEGESALLEDLGS